jgi:hypothetical protein
MAMKRSIDLQLAELKEAGCSHYVAFDVEKNTICQAFDKTLCLATSEEHSKRTKGAVAVFDMSGNLFPSLCALFLSGERVH